jgi:hypothetical protein
MYIITIVTLMLTFFILLCIILRTDFPSSCSFPFTYGGILYSGCAKNIGCLTVNRTATKDCNFSE